MQPGDNPRCVSREPASRTASNAALVKNAVKGTPDRQNEVMQEPTHNEVDSTGKVTPIALEPAPLYGMVFCKDSSGLVRWGKHYQVSL